MIPCSQQFEGTRLAIAQKLEGSRAVDLDGYELEFRIADSKFW